MLQFSSLLLFILILLSASKRLLVNKGNLTATCSTSACIYVANGCGTTLYLQRTTIDGPEGTPTHVTNVNSGSNVVLDISGWPENSGQRLYAWWQDPIGKVLNGVTTRDKVEINWCKKNPSTMCYNPTAVDYFGLPVGIGPYNPSDCSSTTPVTGNGNIRVGSIGTHCPTKYISTPPLGVCQSPGSLCAYNASAPICSSLNSVVSECISDGTCASTSTTPEAFGCSGWFSQQPEWCAAINRGMYNTQKNGGNQNNPSDFYKIAPYNTYSSWIHTDLAKEYAFPYDDYQGAGESGYQSCTTNFMKVTFCPSG